MGRLRTFDIEKALADSAKLFWKKGFDLTSISDLTNQLGIAPASFYFAFESKEKLFKQVIDRYIAFQTEAFDRAFRAPDTSRAVQALLRGYAEVVTDKDHAAGCIVINSSPAIDCDDPLKKWLAAHREDLRRRLQQRFSDDHKAGKLSADSNPKILARFVMTLAGGLAIEARAGASRNELYGMIDMAMTSFHTKMDV